MKCLRLVGGTTDLVVRLPLTQLLSVSPNGLSCQLDGPSEVLISSLRCIKQPSAKRDQEDSLWALLQLSLFSPLTRVDALRGSFSVFLLYVNNTNYRKNHQISHRHSRFYILEQFQQLDSGTLCIC